MASVAIPESERARVLIVDDDERNLLAIRTVIEEVADVVVARSGEEALRHLLKGEFAVILLDVYMPGMDGYETAQIIRSREQTKRIPIVFLSAVNKEAEHLMRGYAMGAVDYVFKPVEAVVLRSKVAVFVDLFAMTKEIQRKARQEQELLDENLRANAELLRTEQELRRAEQELLQARKMDAIGKLTGGIAHDFNNLLAAVLGGIGLLERRLTLEEEHRKILAMTRHAAEQGSDLVSRLLAFARRQKLDPAAIELDRLSTRVSELLAHTLGGLVQAEWDVGEGLWNPYADEAQLELALMNLIINARDAMPEGGVVTVTCANRQLADGEHQGLAGGDYVVLSVTDTGCGIAADVLDQVMEPFFTTKDVGKGTGLGLSMVYGFAKQSGGIVTMRSEVGAGTCVEIWLPRAPSGTLASVTEQEPSASAEVAALNILLVDDHEGVRSATSATLSDMGHSVTDVPAAANALRALERGKAPVDLIITDYAMPLLSGVELIRRARELRPELPAILISGYADGTAIGGRPDNVPILLKPFSRDQLHAAIVGVAGGSAPPVIEEAGGDVRVLSRGR